MGSGGFRLWDLGFGPGVGFELGGTGLASGTVEVPMSRDPHKLRVFHAADRLAVRTYQTTGRFPREERFGLLGQLRRAAVSVACNIVGGSARPGGQAYVHFLNTALASASEARYLADLCARLELLPATQAAELKDEYDALCRSLQSLINTVEPPRPPKA